MAEPPQPPPWQRGAFLQHHVGHLLRRAYGRSRKNTARELAALGELSPVHASALAALMDGPVTQAELGRRIDMEPANTHTLVKRLVTAGLVVPRADPANRRLSLIELTADGRAHAEALEPALRRAADTTLAMLTPEERSHLIALLRRVALE